MKIQSDTKAKILLVDDLQENIEILIHLLEGFDVKILTATSGNKAVELSFKHQFALVLMDVQMPGMDGFETAQAMHSRDDTPIIFITAYSREKKNILKGYNSGAVDYLVKPVDSEILIGKVNVFLTLYLQKEALDQSNRHLANEIKKRCQAELKLTKAKNQLEVRVSERTVELQKAYVELQISKDRVQLVINNLPTMIAFIDRSRCYEYANNPYMSYIQYEGDVQGKHMRDTMREVDYQQLSPYIDSVLQGEPHQFEFELNDHYDKKRVINAKYLPYTKDNSCQGFFLLLQDITDRKAEQEKQRLLATQLAQIRKLKAIETLSRGVSHEFNNLLVPILGFSKLVRNTLADSSTEASYLDRVVNAAYRAKGVLSEIRRLNQKRDLKLEPVKIHDILTTTLEEIIASMPRSIELTTEMDPEAGTFMGNDAQVKQLIQNLCENAIDAMPEGGKLTVKFYGCTSDKLCSQQPVLVEQPCICISIEDTGQGIDEENQQQIFDPFFSTHKDGSHYGLGLSVVLGIVEHLEGAIEINSASGNGTTVRMLFRAIPSPTTRQLANTPSLLPTEEEFV